MLSNARSSIIGFSAGALFAAVILQLLVSQAPDSQALLQHETLDRMMLSLWSSLQIAQRNLYRGGFKSASVAPSRLQRTHQAPSSKFISIKAFSTSISTMADNKSFLEAAKERRSIYALNKESPISDKKIVELVEAAATHVPSAFNSQSTRLVVLLHEEHESFWDQTRDVLKPIVPAPQWEGYTKGKIEGFRASYGTILFLEDPTPTDALKKQYPNFADHFPDWSEHTSAMHQYFLWVALEAEGFGANLQHYNPIIDPKVQSHWKIPREWRLRAQLVFGGRAGEPAQKAFQPLADKVFVHGAKE